MSPSVPVPSIVNVYAPGKLSVRLVEIASVLLAPGITEDGVNVAEHPSGSTSFNPRVTDELYPPIEVTETVYFAVLPLATVLLVGLALIEKLGCTGAFTVMLTVAGTEIACPSLTVKVKLSFPMKVLLGV